MTDRPQSELWEERFRETADLLPGIICEADTRMKITYANEFAFKTFKYSQVDIESGVYLMDLIHSDDRDRAVENVVRLMRGETVGPQEYRLVHKDGSFSDYQLNSSPIRDGDDVTGIRTCIFDISERKRAVERLAASEERFRKIFEESPIGIALFDSEGGLLDGNQAFKTIFGIADAPSAAAFPGLFEMGSKAGAREALMGEEGTARFAHELIAAEEQTECASGQSGSKRLLEWTVGRMTPQAGKESIFLAQIQDITERRAAEEARIEEARAAAKKAEDLVRNLRQEVREACTFSEMVSRSPEMKKIFDILPQVAAVPTTVLVLGESGTGKELVARALHHLGPRKKKPFVAVNCSALPDNLLESELFGYKAGAFTDAKRDKPGKLAMAEGGVLFLDEIGDVSPALQAKLLRVLQERVYEPLGGVRSLTADVRIIAATNRNMTAMVEEGSFREDLFYRINVLKITLPPLRDRRMDIPLLVDHFISRFNVRYNRKIAGISQAALNLLLAHELNGNVRELENIVEHAFVFCTDGEIQPAHLPEEIRGANDMNPARALGKIGSMDELEAHYLRAVLSETGGSKIEAARRLGIHKSTLFRKMKKLGV